MLRIDTATPSDDIYIRDILADTDMDTHISFHFDRKPSYFDSLETDGFDNVTIVGRDREGDVQGFGTCVFRKVLWDREVQTIGYLHNLRLRKGFRNGYSLGFGYKKFNDIAAERGVKYYLTSIMADNKDALRILTSGKGTLPEYHFLTDYYTMIINGSRPIRAGNSQYRIVKASEIGFDKIYEALLGIARQTNGFPYFTFEELFGTCHIPGFSGNDLFCALDNNHNIVGIAGIWDLSSIKSIAINRYSTLLALLRPFYNIFACTSGRPLLPPADSPVNYSYIFPFIAAEGHNECLTPLLFALSSNQQTDYLIAGSTVKPDRRILHYFKPIIMKSKIYQVIWQGIDAGHIPHYLPIHQEVAQL
ncbi:MAG: hypothetical protein SVK54_03010 [candidate division WOR-3 bacterium]|nr:hypothetical protein [candidate division WOR-3 bacterium]